METFGERLRRVRQERGWLQRELAEKTRMCQALISEYERNTKFPNYWHFVELAVRLDVSLDYLAGLDYETARARDRAAADSARRLMV